LKSYTASLALPKMLTLSKADARIALLSLIAILHCICFLKNIITPAVGKEQTAKGGVLYEGVGCSADGYKLAVCHVVPDRMGKCYGLTVVNGEKQNGASCLGKHRFVMLTDVAEG
jgi:hypothetical protein